MEWTEYRIFERIEGVNPLPPDTVEIEQILRDRLAITACAEMYALLVDFPSEGKIPRFIFKNDGRIKECRVVYKTFA